MSTLAEKWVEVGRVEGRAEGEKKGEVNTAVNLKHMGMSLKFIMNATGLSKQEVEDILRDHTL